MTEKKLKSEGSTRRSFLAKATGGAAAVAAAPMMVTKVAEAKGRGRGRGHGVFQSIKRIKEAFNVRQKAAFIQKLVSLRKGPQRDNGDEARYENDNYYASFTKTLPHDRFGEADPRAFEELVRAMKTERQRDFDAISLDRRADRLLANPQGALKFIMSGLDSHATRMKAAPAFRSAKAAAELGEVYWLALTRDVPFSEYNSDGMIGMAIDDLNGFSQTVGPKSGGVITADTLFRGATTGDLTGPYITQFLWKNVPYGPSLIEQRYNVPLAGVDFMTTRRNWLNVQRGGAPVETLAVEADKRYIYNNRALGEYVHTDVLFQAYFNACFIALGYGGAALDDGNPYKSQISNQGGFTSFGGPFIIDLVCKAGNLALTGAWYHKWSIHRRLRPEAMAGRVHFHLKGRRNYELHRDILNSKAVDEVRAKNGGTYFLPMAFTEGSPTHPSYPAGHATVAGACTTVLKACFNESFVIPDPVVANNDGSALDPYSGPDLTLGGEFNKLANNISLGRDAAGVHYRTDGEDGLLVGEQQAIAMLQDATLTTNEGGSFTLTKFDGTKIRIENGKVRKI